MNRESKFITTYLFFSLLLLSACGVTKDEFEVLKNENEALMSEIIAIRSQMDLQDRKIDQLSKSSEDLAKEKESLSSNLDNLQQNISSTKAQVEAVEFNLREKQFQINQLWNELDVAFSDVENAVSQSNQRIKSLEEMLYLDLNEEINFDPGSDEIDPEDEEQLAKLAQMLIQNPKLTMMIEGHTDDQQVEDNSEKYRDNWDLSVSRSTQIVRKLEDLGVNPEQLIASGRGEHKPNTMDPDNRDKNRRAEFIVVPNVGKLYRMSKQSTASKTTGP